MFILRIAGPDHRGCSLRRGFAVRAWFVFYNMPEEIDVLVEAVARCICRQAAIRILPQRDTETYGHGDVGQNVSAQPQIGELLAGRANYAGGTRFAIRRRHVRTCLPPHEGTDCTGDMRTAHA